MRAPPPSLLLVLLALLAVAPGATAQAEPATEPLVIAPEAPEAPVRPIVDHVPVPVEVRLNCALRAAQGGPVNLTLHGAPEWLIASPAAQNVELPEATACEGGYVTTTANITFQATSGAPAGPTPEMRLTATRGAASAEANLTLAVGAFVIVDGFADSPVRLLKPGASAEVQVTVTNYGNAPVEVAFGLTSDTPVDVALPDAVQLAPRQAGAGNSTAVPVGVTAPATPGETHEFRVLLTARTTGNATPMERTSDVGLIVHVKGDGLLSGATDEVPGAGAGLAAVAAGAASLLRRRRRPQ